MDRVLHLHLEHQSSSSPKKRCGHGGVARFRKGVDASRAVLALAAMASLALFLGRPLTITLPPWLLAVAAGSGLLTTKTALFVLSNAIFILLAADCRWFFAAGAYASDGIADACDEPGGVPEKQGRHHHHEEEMQRSAVQVQSCVPCSGCDGTKSISTAPEASTEPGTVVSDSTATFQVLEDEEDVPATSRPELLELLDEAESVALDLETIAVDEPSEPTCETDTARGLDELGIDELNRRFDEFIESRKNKWVKEENYLQWHQGLTCEQLM